HFAAKGREQRKTQGQVLEGLVGNGVSDAVKRHQSNVREPQDLHHLTRGEPTGEGEITQAFGAPCQRIELLACADQNEVNVLDTSGCKLLSRIRNVLQSIRTAELSDESEDDPTAKGAPKFFDT